MVTREITNREIRKPDPDEGKYKTRLKGQYDMSPALFEGRPPKTIDEVRIVWSEWAGNVKKQKLRKGEGPVKAYINHGRWVADCPHCNGGIACMPEHSQGCCLTCLRVYDVVYPNWSPEMEAELLKRPAEVNRNWVEGETLEDLEKETKGNGGLGRVRP